MPLTYSHQRFIGTEALRLAEAHEAQQLANDRGKSVQEPALVLGHVPDHQEPDPEDKQELPHDCDALCSEAVISTRLRIGLP